MLGGVGKNLCLVQGVTLCLRDRAGQEPRLQSSEHCKHTRVLCCGEEPEHSRSCHAYRCWRQCCFQPPKGSRALGASVSVERCSDFGPSNRQKNLLRGSGQSAWLSPKRMVAKSTGAF